MTDPTIESGKDQSAPAGGLQFDHVESAPAAGPPPPGELPPLPALPAAAGAPQLACQVCGREIREEYYEMGGKVACPSCHAAALAKWSGGSPAGRFLRAALLGAVAGLAGCLVYYLVLKLTGYEFGLIAILVGYAVGIAVRSGSRGHGGWPYQLLAVGLTYLSIVGSYLPLILAELGEVSAAGLIVLVPMMLALPFLGGLENILGLLIIGFGLWEAWRLNRRQEWSAAGPFRTGAAAA